MADLGRFLQLVEETESFRGCGQEKVAKIVQCGEAGWQRKIDKFGGLVVW